MSLRNRLLTILVLTGFTVAYAAAPVAAQGDASVTLDDRASGGYTLVVDKVTLPSGGFVTIHDASLQDGKALESVVGFSSKLSAGTHEDVRVPLDNPISEDQVLIAMPHRDTDGDAIYDFLVTTGQTDAPYTSGGGPVTDAANVTASAEVDFSDQPSDGTSVVVDRVELSAGGFVTIHNDLLRTGQPIASVAGTSGYLQAGIHENVRVSLDMELNSNQTLTAMPHRDTDDDQQYDFVTSGGQSDGPYANETGSPVVDPGNVTLPQDAQVTYEDQTSGGHQVAVASVLVPDGGFVTIHDRTLLQGKALQSVRGTSGYLQPGLHRSVQVPLDDPVTEDGTLIAMPHRDTNGNQQYDFVSSDGSEDGPYTSGGGPVTDPGNTTIAASVSYSAQVSDGRKVTIDSVDLSEPGFVTFHDPTLFTGQTLQSVVGVSDRLDAGLHEDVQVSLQTPIKGTRTLVAMPHKDTNDNGDYDFVSSDGSADGPFTDAGGAVVDPARTTVHAQVTFRSQALGDDDKLTVRSVTTTKGGFVTLHDSSLLQGQALQSVIGFSDHLGPGTHTDVRIEVSGLTADDTVIAMPHRDTNDNEQYDFVTSDGQEDGPYTWSGGAVVHPAQVTVEKVTDGGDGEPTPGFGLVALLAAAGAAAALVGRR